MPSIFLLHFAVVPFTARIDNSQNTTIILLVYLDSFGHLAVIWVRIFAHDDLSMICTLYCCFTANFAVLFFSIKHILEFI